MNNLQIFKNEEFGQVRTIRNEKDIWFAAKDICNILELSNTTVAIQNLDEDEVTKLNLGSQYGETNFINESGLYTLIIRSRKTEAKRFRKWVTSEVLPSIRKTGMYATNELLDNPDLAIKVFEQLKQEREEKKQLTMENAQQKQIIGELKPKADYLDRILKSKSIVPISYIAKDYGMTAQALNRKLHDLGVQYKIGNTWLLYKEYQAFGYTHSKITEFKRKDDTWDTNTTMEWTQKGRLFLYELLKKNNIVPVIEK